MKKIFIGAVVFLSFMMCVKGEVYYSDYGGISDWDSKEVLGSDVVEVESERRYKYYHENIIGDYYLEGSNREEYPFIDKENYKEIETEWLDTIPELIPNQTIETRKVYGIKKALPIRYIKFTNPYGGYGVLRISEIEIYSGSNKISYDINCVTCNEYFYERINNGIINENYSHVVNGGEITIDLKNYYEVENLKIVLYMYDVTSDTKNLSIYLYRDLNGDRYYFTHFLNAFTSTLENPFVAEFFVNRMTVGNPGWSDEVISLNKEIANKWTQVTEYEQYRSINKYYYYYNIIKEYSDNYSEYYNNKDEEQYIDYYRYKVRNKIEVKDELIIDNYNQRIDEFIKSDIAYKIEGNIDYSKNGKYQIKIITPFNTIEKELLVNIPNNDNYVNLYNEYIDAINNYNVELNKLNIEKDEYESALKIKNNESNIMQKQYENELLNLKMQDKEEVIIKEECEEANQFYQKKKYIIIILSIILLISIISLIFEIKNKN